MNIKIVKKSLTAREEGIIINMEREKIPQKYNLRRDGCPNAKSFIGSAVSSSSM
jgi:hypothetical protein